MMGILFIPWEENMSQFSTMQIMNNLRKLCMWVNWHTLLSRPTLKPANTLRAKNDPDEIISMAFNLEWNAEFDAIIISASRHNGRVSFGWMWYFLDQHKLIPIDRLKAKKKKKTRLSKNDDNLPVKRKKFMYFSYHFSAKKSEYSQYYLIEIDKIKCHSTPTLDYSTFTIARESEQSKWFYDAWR